MLDSNFWNGARRPHVPILVLLCSLVACQSSPPATELPDRIFLIGADALSAERLDHLLERDELPNFARLVQDGTRVDAALSQPVEPVSLWTTALTGKVHEKHRQLGHIAVLPTGQRSVTPSSGRRTQHLWQLLSRNSVMSAGVGFPGTWPAEVINGFLVSNMIMPTRWSLTEEVNFERLPGLAETIPPLLFDEIEELLHSDEVPREDIARFFILHEDEYAMIYDDPLGSVLSHSNPLRDIAVTLQVDRSYADVALYIHENYSPRVNAVYLEILQATQSAFWPFTDPDTFETPEDSNRRFRETVDQAYRFVDEQLGRFLAQMTERSILIVASEHGFTTGYAPEGSANAGRPLPISDAPATFLFYGYGVQRGQRIESGRVADLTPTILALLGKDVASDMDGSVLVEVMSPEFWEAHPVRPVASYDVGWPDANRYPAISGLQTGEPE